MTETKTDSKTETKTPTAAATDKAVADRASQLQAEGMGANEAQAQAQLEANEAKRAADQAKADKEAKGKVKGPLAPAAESGDPEVQKLLADRQGHLSNLSSLRPEPSPLNADAADVVEAKIRDIDERLAELGYTAS